MPVWDMTALRINGGILLNENRADVPAISPWFYRLCRVLGRIAGRLLFSLETKRDPALDDIEGGLLILANHQSYADPLLMATAFPDRMIHFVAGRYLFEKKWTKRIFRRLGVIAKEQMRPDARTIRDLLVLARRGESLFLFPEGQRSVDGRTNVLHASTARLVKKLGLPVAVVRMRGAYLSWPRWSKGGVRRGKISQEASLLFTAQDVACLSPEDLVHRLEQALFVDEYADQLARAVPRLYSGRKRAERLDAILHWCPVCRGPFLLKAEDEHLTCCACELTMHVEATGLLTSCQQNNSHLSPSPAAWHEEQVRAWHQHVLEHGFHFGALIGAADQAETRVTVSVKPEGFFIRHENGMAALVSHDGVPALFAEYGDFFRLFHDAKPLIVRPDNGQAVVACLDLIKAGYLRNNTAVMVN